MGIGDVIVWVVFGLVVGALGRLLVPGRNPMGCLATILLGIAGSVVGGLIAYALRLGTREYSPGGFIMSVIGAVVALLLYYQIRGRRM
jgi:uncharacterized membrane protein YeaQ/YmgE (transglycosylase-associated protein family)